MAILATWNGVFDGSLHYFLPLIYRDIFLHDFTEEDGGVAAGGEGEGEGEVGAMFVGVGGEGEVGGEEAQGPPAAGGGDGAGGFESCGGEAEFLEDFGFHEGDDG